MAICGWARQLGRSHGHAAGACCTLATPDGPGAAAGPPRQWACVPACAGPLPAAALALRRWHAATVTGEPAMACALPEHWQRAAPSGRTKRTAQDATQACPVHMHHDAPRPRVWIGSSLRTGVTAYCAGRMSTPALSWAQT